MEWIVKIEKNPEIETEKDQRIRIAFNPMAEKIHFYGEAKIKNNQWFVFSENIHKMEIALEQLQKSMETVVKAMRRRLEEYENLNNGFSVLKIVAFEDDEVIDD